MGQWIIFQKRPCSYESNRQKLNHSNKSKEYLLQSLLRILIEDSVWEFENDSIVDKIHEKKVKNNCPAYLFAWFFYQWALRSLSD